MPRPTGFKLPPPNLLLIYLIVAAELSTLAIFKFNVRAPSGGKVYAVLFGGAVFCIFLWLEPWRLRPRCSLFYRPGKSAVVGRAELLEEKRVEIPCGECSVGRVRIGSGRKKYFCGRHDPESPSMQRWMKDNLIYVVPGTLKRFKRF